MERSEYHHGSAGQPRSYRSCMPVHIDKGVFDLAQAHAEAAKYFKVIASSNINRRLKSQDIAR